jgi:hypothetical protein
MIRRWAAISLSLIFSIQVSAQVAVSTTVPQQVLASFQARYPSVTAGVTWTQDAGYYEPVFMQGGIQYVGYIDQKGRFIQTIAKLRASELPTVVTTYINQNYSGGKISDAGKIDFVGSMPSRYYAKVNGKELLFDNIGAFIKITTSPLKQ